MKIHNIITNIRNSLIPALTVFLYALAFEYKFLPPPHTNRGRYNFISWLAPLFISFIISFILYFIAIIILNFKEESSQSVNPAGNKIQNKKKIRLKQAESRKRNALVWH